MRRSIELSDYDLYDRLGVERYTSLSDEERKELIENVLNEEVDMFEVSVADTIIEHYYKLKGEEV